jgi:hypothetical protein
MEEKTCWGDSAKDYMLSKGIEVKMVDTEFGIIIPMKTGIAWNVQCDGMECGQQYIEGLMIPMEKHSYKTELDIIKYCNYHDDGSKFYVGMRKKCWEELQKELPFKYEEINDYQKKKIIENIEIYNTEAVQWIKIIGVNECYEKQFWESLIGKEVIMFYPNCD